MMKSLCAIETKESAGGGKREGNKHAAFAGKFDNFDPGILTAVPTDDHSPGLFPVPRVYFTANFSPHMFNTPHVQYSSCFVLPHVHFGAYFVVPPVYFPAFYSVLLLILYPVFVGLLPRMFIMPLVTFLPLAC